MTNDHLHSACCRCRDCAPPLVGQRSQRSMLALIYGPGLIAAVALFSLLVSR